jgi:OST-HTH/LOTUS domain
MQEMFRDYKEAEGEDIPFRRFGYNSLEKMLTDSDEFTVSRNLSGAIQIRAKVSEETQHITRMKAAEKTTSKKRGGGGVGGFKAAPRRLNTNFNSRQNQSAYTNNYSRMSTTPLRSMPKYNQSANKPRVTYTQSSNTYSYGGNKSGGNGFSKPAPSLNNNNNNNYKYKSNYVPEDRSNLPSVTYVGGVDMRRPQFQQTSRPATQPPSPVKRPEASKSVEKPKPVEAPKPVERKVLLTTSVQRSISTSSEPKTATVKTSAVKKVPVNAQILMMPPVEYRPSPLQNVNVTTSSLNNRLIRHTRSYEDKLTVTFPNGDQTQSVAAPMAGRKSVQDRIKLQRVEQAPQQVFVQVSGL